jgi:hypothetical protein
VRATGGAPTTGPPGTAEVIGAAGLRRNSAKTWTPRSKAHSLNNNTAHTGSTPAGSHR